MVHAIDHAARQFYKHFEFGESPVDPYQLLLLLKDLRKATCGRRPGLRPEKRQRHTR